MDWEKLGRIDIAIGIIQAIWGIANILLTVKMYLMRKSKEEFLIQLEEERTAAVKEQFRVCTQCKRATQKTINILQKSNEQLIAKV